MNILFLSRWFPFPADNGAKIRVYNLLRQLSKRHTVDLVAFADGEVSPQALEELHLYCRKVVNTSIRSFQPQRLKAILGLFSSRPRSLIDTYDREMQRLVIRVAKEGDHQLVIASERDMTVYTQPLRKLAKIFEEVELAALYEQSLISTTPAQRLRPTLMWWKWVNYIEQLRHQFDGFTVVSAREQDLLEKIFQKKGRLDKLPPVQIIPNGVAIEDYQGDFGAPLPDRLIFTGALTYNANFDAAAFFIKEIFPQIKQIQPGAQLTVTGNLSGVSLEKLGQPPGVFFSGYLDDVRPAIAQSWASVAPLRLGGGTRLKILESLAIGTPVITTRKGAEGLDLKDGRDILLANSASDFAAQTVRLLNDAGLRKSLSRNGKQTVAELYDWEKIGTQFCDYVEQIVAKKENSAPRSVVR